MATQSLQFGSRLPLALLALLAAGTGCYNERDPLTERGQACTGCHGSGPGNGPNGSAPPPGLWLFGGRSSTEVRGVGAHELHLQGGALAAPVSCDTCHLVPSEVDAPGHLDDDLPAELRFSGRANADQAQSSYDPRAGTCSTYCHGATLAGGTQREPLWTRVDGTQTGCNACHGFPPPAPHPQSSACAACHGQVVDGKNAIVAKALHVNGTVEVLRDATCHSCHGSATNDAPPQDSAGRTEVSVRGVGVHQSHARASALHAAYGCSVCHVTPTRLEDAAHLDDSPNAEVSFGGTANARGTRSSYDVVTLSCATYCHNRPGASGASWRWTTPRTLGCASCHGFPPPAPHPAQGDCGSCHEGVVAAGDPSRIINPTKHANGQVDFDD